MVAIISSGNIWPWEIARSSRCVGTFRAAGFADANRQISKEPVFRGAVDRCHARLDSHIKLGASSPVLR